MGSFDHKSLDELLYTQRLADNDDIVRSRTLKKLKKFLNLKSQQQGFSYEDLIKIWKGLYYCMYMADKSLVQEDLAEDVSNLIHEFSSNSQKLLFFKVALDTFAREWPGIDKFRMDKFFMLFTRVLRQCLFHLLNINWNIGEVKQMSEILESSVICPYDETNRKPMGLKLHLAKTILHELAKVGKESVPDKVLVTLLYPFLKVMAVSSQNFYIKTIRNYILDALIKQSELGIEHQEDLTLNELEIAEPDEDDCEEIAEEEDEDFVMDPRAGGVDVYLPLIKPNYKLIANTLQSVGSIREVPRKNRQLLYHHANLFRKMANNVYPLPNPVAKYDVEKVNRKKLVRDAVNKRLTSEFNDKPSGKRKVEDSEAAVSVKKRRRKNLKSRVKQPKISKEEVKKNVRKASKKKSALKAKLNNPDKILKSVTKGHGDNSDCTKQAVSSDKGKFQVTPKKPIKKTIESSRNDGWQVKKLLSNSTGPREHVMAKKTQKRKGTEAISKTLSTEDVPVPPMKSSVETRMQSSKAKKHKKSLKSEATEKRKKITIDPLQRKATKVQTGKKILGEGVDPKTSQTLDREERITGSIPTTKSSLEVSKDKPKFENLQTSLKLKSAGKRKKIVNGSPLNDSNPVSVQKLRKSKKTGAAVSAEKTRNLNVSGNIQNDPWKEDLKEGETEIVIMSKKFAKKKMPKRLNMVIQKTPKMNTKGKTLKINLRKNEEHDWKDYNKVLKSSPGIPFSANKRPSGSVLKSATQQNLKKRKSCRAKINSIKSKYNL